MHIINILLIILCNLAFLGFRLPFSAFDPLYKDWSLCIFHYEDPLNNIFFVWVFQIKPLPLLVFFFSVTSFLHAGFLGLHGFVVSFCSNPTTRTKTKQRVRKTKTSISKFPSTAKLLVHVEHHKHFWAPRPCRAPKNCWASQSMSKS